MAKGAVIGLREKTVQGRTIGDANQLGGAMVIRSDGIVTWSHMSTDAARQCLAGGGPRRRPVRNADLAGTFIALACGVVGWFVVLRGQLFCGDALTHVAFVGAIGAAVLGFDELIGLFVLTLAVAAAMAALGRRGEADDAAIGIVFAWILGVGALLLAILATSPTGGNGVAAANALFGSIYSLTAGGSRLAVGLAGAAYATATLITRRVAGRPA